LIEEIVKTSVYLRKDQKDLIQKLFRQDFSRRVRQLADALIQETDLDQLPADVAEAVIHSRIIANKRLNFEKELETLKSDFFDFLDKENYPLIISRFSEKKAKKAGREFAVKYYYTTQKIIPECHIYPFITEYYKYAHYSGKVNKARLKLERNKINSEPEVAEAS
jgi:hypothetical protein